jgi:hypothetical protein
MYYSPISDSPNLEGQVPVFTSQRERVAWLLGSLYIASYDSLGYGGIIPTSLLLNLPRTTYHPTLPLSLSP